MSYRSAAIGSLQQLIKQLETAKEMAKRMKKLTPAEMAMTLASYDEDIAALNAAISLMTEHDEKNP